MRSSSAKLLPFTGISVVTVFTGAVVLSVRTTRVIIHRAEDARSVAVQANKSAQQSGLVADAINAMERIKRSSEMISSIIGVIDRIASRQTSSR